MSLRLRLTLLYSAILALTLLGLGVVLVVSVSQVTLSTMKSALLETAKRTIYAREFRLDHPGYDSRRIAMPDTYIQTLNPTGVILARTSNLGDFQLPIDTAKLQAAANGESWTEIAVTENGRLFVFNHPLMIRGELVGIVQLARSLAEQDESLATLRNILLAGSLVVVVFAFIIGWVLSGAALRPIQRITATAHVIGAQRDFDRRVDYRGPPDEVGHLATTFNDMLDELQAAYRQTEQALQAQRRLVADASHELRTPLTTIRGNLGLLKRQPPIAPEDEEAVLNDMVDETDRLIRLTNDLLVLARSDAGRPLRRVAVPLGPLVDDVCRQAKLLGATRTIVCAEVPSVSVVGDPDAIKQVLLILLDNALKFTPAGGTITIGANIFPEVQLNARTETRSDNLWEDQAAAIFMRDTGPGIAPDAQPHIFERFYRSDEARSGAGAGLGLAIAKELIEAQAGQIEVESEMGSGSTFSVTLPLA
ncbi:two-component system, OmpR family, sensor kinase [Thermoflexales bacterium]|nr:two-component system, OmpR family, sensor kinase [Thermoflexales bacterium]